MGVGPAFAIPAVLKDVGLSVDDVDVYEINEAFASQALYCSRVLKINPEKVNPKGGAIALGHPLGMTGARQIATLLPQLKNTNQSIGVVSMCMGAGMVKPIMKAHNWRIGTLEEFYRTGLLGMNTNRGAKIELCLRYHNNENEFLPWEEILGTMLHELAHNIRGPHDAQFYKALNDLNDEYDKVVASGYSGEGFDSQGKKLGTKNGLSGRFGSVNNIISVGGLSAAANGGNGGTLFGGDAKAAAALAAEKRRRANEIMLPAGGRTLGGDSEGRSTLGGNTEADRKFWEKWHSPGELAAMAAERRAKDKIWRCSGIIVNTTNIIIINIVITINIITTTTFLLKHAFIAKSNNTNSTESVITGSGLQRKETWATEPQSPGPGKGQKFSPLCCTWHVTSIIFIKYTEHGEKARQPRFNRLDSRSRWRKVITEKQHSTN
ncbi:3-ketoacyl-CoA thiolase, peroxisomal [Podila humilis]|nr:3-ketoacyl-CoA thiolase, peroxisomal [Podila humilis]